VRYTRPLIVAGLVLVLGAVNWSIWGKERIKASGAVVYLDLAPLDPRSIMQGDYMALRFRLAQEIEASVKPLPLEGAMASAGVAVDERRVARLARPGESPNLRIRYRIRQGAVWLGTNAFFFEEGSDKRYAVARFGEFRVDAESGEAVLVGLRDEKLQPL